MTPKILFVDDDPHILNSFKRMLRNSFDLELAVGPHAGITALEQSGPFAVVIADMKMPELSGIEFLKIVRKKNPSTVRLMLTGNVDQTTAVQAVNEGQVFKFLNKPCSTEELTVAINEALEQNRLISAEKDLLQNTLVGSIKILTDILHFSKVGASSRSNELRDFVKSQTQYLTAYNLWELELSAMLSEIGFLTVPGSIMDRFYLADSFTTQEIEILSKLPETSYQLLHNLPRLEKVAEIVRDYLKAIIAIKTKTLSSADTFVPGALVLLSLSRLVDLKKADQYNMTSLSLLIKEPLVNKQLLASIIANRAEVVSVDSNTQPAEFTISLKELCAGQKLIKDLRTEDGMLIATAGHTLNSITIQRIKNYAELKGLEGEIVVDCRMPTVGSN